MLNNSGRRLKEGIEKLVGDRDQNTGPTTGAQGTMERLGLPEVTDPDQAFADVAAAEYEQFVTEFRPFEEELVEQAQTDTSIVDAVRPTVETQTQVARDIARRNRERYGVQETGAQRRERVRAEERGRSLNLAGGLTNARLRQDDVNTRLLGQLINIGQNLNRTSMSELGTAASLDVQRSNRYKQDRAQYKSGVTRAIGSLIGSALSLI